MYYFEDRVQQILLGVSIREYLLIANLWLGELSTKGTAARNVGKKSGWTARGGGLSKGINSGMN